MVSPKKWYKPNPYKNASDGSSFGKSSTMVLLLVVQAILCSLYLYYGETSHDYGSSSRNDGIITFKKSDEDATMKELEFKKAYIVHFSENLDANGEKPMYIKFTVSAEELTMGSATHENRWPKA